MSDGGKDSRNDFLLEMYKQTSSHLNRHILITWQSIGVIAGALAIFGLTDKFNLAGDERLDFVTAVVTVLCAWTIAHIYDANNWFDRNLHIITNVERQFLLPSDSKDIHFFFTGHRRERSEKELVLHFQIQLAMVLALWFLIIGYHFYKRVWPGRGFPIENIELVRAIPYVAGMVCAFYCWYVIRDTREGYGKLVENSPGKKVSEVSQSTGNDGEDISSG